MDIYILRHGIAVVRGAPGIERDSDRSLSEKGATKMRRIARGMKALGLSFDVILTSPYLRARQTAEIVAAEFDAEKKLELCPHLEVAGDPAELVVELQARSDSLESVLLVGHEPYLSELVSVLISGDERTEVTMKKGGLCKLTADKISYGHCANLDWLLAPKQLTRIA